MTKQTKIEAIKEIFQKPEPGQIRIFIQAGPSDKKTFFKETPASTKNDLEITAPDQEMAESIFKFLTEIENNERKL